MIVMATASFNLNLLASQGLGSRHYPADEKIFVSGDPGDCMYVVESGAVQIVNYGTILDKIGPGDIFGEMALIDNSPRSATAIAIEPTTVIAVDREAFEKLSKHDPAFSLEVMRRLAERLRNMNTNM